MECHCFVFSGTTHFLDAGRSLESLNFIKQTPPFAAVVHFSSLYILNSKRHYSCCLITLYIHFYLPTHLPFLSRIFYLRPGSFSSCRKYSLSLFFSRRPVGNKFPIFICFKTFLSSLLKNISLGQDSRLSLIFPLLLERCHYFWLPVFPLRSPLPFLLLLS